jgi:nucleoside-diphosphate-sugar epimerase
LTSISLFGGSGFIGGSYRRLSTNEIDIVNRNNPNPQFCEVVYAIGTTDNYNVLSNPTLDLETNLLKLINDLELLRSKFGKFTFNFLSTWFVYGENSELPFKETQVCNPKGFYSISKFAAEMFIRSYCDTFDINYRIFRLANVFGDGDKGVSKKKNALQYLINEIKLGNNVEVYEGGEFFRDYIDVRDVVSAIDLAILEAPSNVVINIGTGQPSKFIDLLQRAKSDFGSTSQLVSIVTPDFHKKVQVRDAYMDITLLKSFGFVTKYNIFDEIIHL